MSDRRWYIETSPDGRHQFVSIKRSRSHHYYDRPRHHHEFRCRDDCARVTRTEWNDLVERECKLREANDGLTRDNYTLKCELQSSDAEGRRLSGLVTALQTENQALRDENASLRCSAENAGGHASKHLREIEKLKQKLCKAEKERDGLLDRVRELSRHAHHGVSERIEELRRLVIAWERKFDVVDDHNKRLRRDIEHQRCIIAEQDDRIRAYERVLRRHGFL
ncbi:hypothetical protein CCHL11_01386 [Colletotrichum chlorophyti]|uniref:Uncharacterized protein n=1 Tax=Colletotrichum chlorophyti TaxID=708187 RepID=A0A1Q8RYM8_9PEZI|nr:hypothetical protein CCHL11_01386 [Colletotrichum chlorophyti]